MLLRVVDQAQRLVRDGDISRWLLNASSRRYVDINGVDEVQAIAKHLSDVVVYKVLPKIRPELDALLTAQRCGGNAPGTRLSGAKAHAWL